MQTQIFSLLVFTFLIYQINSTPVLFHEWVSLNYTWDANHTYSEYMENDWFIVENCIMAGINVDIDGEIYLTVPRWREGVPATLNILDQQTWTLTPYPSWDDQEIGVSGDLQNCQSMTIDSKRRMWVIDVGRRNFFGDDPEEIVNGPAGIWVIDLETNEVISKYYFPRDIVSYNNSFLNDLVVDDTLDIAYITDAWGEGGIVVYELNTNTSRRYTGESTIGDPEYVMIINGINYGNQVFTVPIDGIAITPDFEVIFVAQIQGTRLYRIPTAILRNFSATFEEIDEQVQFLGYKEPSDGMKYLDGILYWGSLTTSTYYYTVINETDFPFLPTTQVIAPPSVETMNWIDTFAIDLQTNSALWFVSNRLNLYSTNTMDFSGASGANMRILYFNVTDSDGTTTSDSDDDDDDGPNYRTGFIVVMILLSLLVVGLLFLVVRNQSNKNPERTPLML
eukprot:TRINITY_DN176_c0_g2_i1.p1 TRINITY_DN176_c0_g2~~TRINITY_DN176_c0_g2_i1.p1  ORF type:complete len:450 (-),score=106.67 TRINITY_DN176_c0_g2_i1:148-1497(-)